MENGFRHGYGIYRYSNGDEYHGEWKEGKRSGKGKLTMSDLSEYEGNWSNGKKNGKGIMKFHRPDPNDPTAQERYDGEFRDDYREGEGAYIYFDGTRY